MANQWSGQLARPRKEVDFELADKAAALFCNGEEIASLCKVSYDTLEKRIKDLGYASFADWYGERTADTVKSLRRKQLEMALKGDRVMLIWLGKNLLGQAEKLEQTTTDKKVYVNVFENENPIRKNTKTG